MRSKQDYKVGELCLVPAVKSMQNILSEKRPGAMAIDTGVMVDKEHVYLYLTKPSQPKASDRKKWQKGDTVVPYFWVTDNAVVDGANCKVKSERYAGFKLPYVINTKVLKQSVVLTVEKEEEAPKRKLADTTIVADGNVAAESTSSAPKKAAKAAAKKA